jgi:hypothetical protein
MTTITLPPRCDRAAAEAMLPELQAALGAGALTIDGSAARQIGQAMLQLLASARISGNGAEIIASPGLRDAARLAGLEATLFENAKHIGTAA